MDMRISMVTLGVADVARSRDFYTRLGWTASPSPEGLAFFQAGGTVFALWERSALGIDSGTEDLDRGGWGGVTLAVNMASPADVDEVIAHAEQAGALVVRAPGQTYWGGYSGVFTDPDDHPWEIAYNPFWTITEDGRTLLGDGRG